MSRNNKVGGSLPNPTKSIFEISAKGYVRFYNKESKKNIMIADLVAQKKELKINEVIKLKTPLKFIFIDDSFFIKAYDKPRAIYANSTAYQLTTESIAVYEGNSKTPVWKGMKKDSKSFFDSFSSYSTCMNIIVMSPKNGELCRIELQASGRSSFFDFKKGAGIYENLENFSASLPVSDYGYFEVYGFMRVLQGNDDEKTIMIPVFREVAKTEENQAEVEKLMEQAGKVCDVWDLYNESRKSVYKKEDQSYIPKKKPNTDNSPESQKEADELAKITSPTKSTDIQKPEPALEDDLPF